MLITPITIGLEKKQKKMASFKVKEANRTNNRKICVLS